VFAVVVVVVVVDTAAVVVAACLSWTGCIASGTADCLDWWCRLSRASTGSFSEILLINTLTRRLYFCFSNICIKIFVR
jgi:hypothetical protein